MNKLVNTVSFLALLSATAFDNKAGWKLDADGKIEMKDGNPIWVDANGGESVMAGDTITRLNSEAKQLRQRAEKAETTAKAFEGLDADTAKKAIETVSKIDAKTLIDAGKVDEVKKQITDQFTAQLTEKDKALNELQSRYDGSIVSNLFAGSNFLRERIAVPADMFEATFKQNVKVKDGKPEFYGRDGNQIMSKQRIGEMADAEEAFAILVEQHPQRDVILKASDANGTNSNGNGGNRGGSRTMKRTEFNALDQRGQIDAAAKQSKGELRIVD